MNVRPVVVRLVARADAGRGEAALHVVDGPKVFALGSAVTGIASSSAPWRVFATGSDTSAYGAYANASADAPHSTALAIRATSSPGRQVKVSAFVSCQMDDVGVTSGAVIVLVTPRYRKCSVSGSASTDYSGRVKVELLRRP